MEYDGGAESKDGGWEVLRRYMVGEMRWVSEYMCIRVPIYGGRSKNMRFQVELIGWCSVIAVVMRVGSTQIRDSWK